ncbi:MAG TPA: DUF4238 domain-containing protein, partial [bacterium]
DADISYERARDFVEGEKYEIEVPASVHIASEMKIFDKMLPYIFHRRWVLLRAPANKTGFVTADHPACLLWSEPAMRNKNLPPGLGLKETKLVFPVSNELALVGAFEGEDDEREASELEIAEINGVVMEHAARWFYVRDADFLYKIPPNLKINRGADLVAQLGGVHTKPPRR